LKLDNFINGHIDEILAEWEAFAHTLLPAADEVSKLVLRNHAGDILKAIALDITTSQDSQQQQDKSRGMSPDIGAKSAASIHGALRQAGNFTPLQLGAEFRALRATVLRLWLPHIRGMSSDTITEMIRFNEAIDQALAESVVTYSARAEETRELFLAILGHDLRAPLSTMTMAGGLLARPSLPVGKVAVLGERVRRAAGLMSSMVNDLIGFTRTQLGGGMPMQAAQAHLRDICEAAIEDASATHPDTDFELKASGELTGFFDAVRLHQMFTNLLVNAAQYGGPDQPVVMLAHGDDRNITISVTNQGGTIPADSLESVFQPLVQLGTGKTGDTRPRTSLGLGLFVAREIAVTHGGNLTVTSSDANGTTFTARFLRMPVAARHGLHLLATHDGEPLSAIPRPPPPGSATVLKH
jgi:signal transduction histidine kinase